MPKISRKFGLVYKFQRFFTFMCKTSKIATYSIGTVGNKLQSETRTHPIALSTSLLSSSTVITSRLPSAVPTVNWTEEHQLSVKYWTTKQQCKKTTKIRAKYSSETKANTTYRYANMIHHLAILHLSDPIMRNSLRLLSSYIYYVECLLTPVITTQLILILWNFTPFSDGRFLYMQSKI